MLSFIEKLKNSLLPSTKLLSGGVQVTKYPLSGLHHYAFQMMFRDSEGFVQWYRGMERYLNTLGFFLETGEHKGEIIVRGCEFCSRYPMRIDATYAGTQRAVSVTRFFTGPATPVFRSISLYDIAIDIPQTNTYSERDWTDIIVNIRRIGAPELSVSAP